MTTNTPRELELSRCVAFNVYGQPDSTQDPCITLLYAPQTDFTNGVMQRLAAATGLALGSDIVGLADGPTVGYYIYDNIQRQVDAAVVFNDTQLGGLVDYAIWTNSSRTTLYARHGDDDLWRYVGVSGRLLALQKEVDAAIVAQLLGAATGGTTPVFDVTVAPFTDVESSVFIGGGAALTVRTYRGIGACGQWACCK
jgi:hypothetical protein